MADPNDKGPRWERLSVYLARALPGRNSPLRCNDFVGPLRLESSFGEQRRRGKIRVRGRPGMPHAPLVEIPPGEWFGYVLHEQADRYEHVHSKTTFYGTEVCEIATPPRGVRRTVGKRHDELVAAIDAYQRDHPGAGYPEIVKAVITSTGASREAVRTAMRDRSQKPRRGPR
jgi:hypothetical protein